MKKVLIAPGFGSGGWSTYASYHAKQLAEDETLIALVEAGKHLDAGVPSEAFRARCLEIVGDVCRMPYIRDIYALEVHTVDGPYRIIEYDGSESIELRSEVDWW